MPEERGSIYKTTANEIGEALKAKLGGEGFAPKDWSDNLNLLGIASEDTEAAINSLKESEGSGERGSILLSTANAIGSMLNKKYNSQRGFSPAEWASATRKMKALETDTKSGGIVNLKGAKEVPITSLVGTVNPTLEGTDTLVATRLGKNLIDVGTAQGSGTIWFNYDDGILLKKGEIYTFSCKNYGTGSIALYALDHSTQIAYAYITESSAKVGYRPTEDTIVCPIIYQSGLTVSSLVDVQLEVGSEATEYTPYKAPTTYTANLGRTIYGGSADIVKGEGEDENGDAFTFDPIPINTSGDTENFYTSNGDTSITYYEEPTPYTRGSASGMIASIPEANTEFPFTKLKATIAPSVEGKDTVEVKNEGKNLFDKDNAAVMTGYIGSSYYIEANPQTRTVYIPIRSGTAYTVEKMVTSRFTIATAPNIPSNNEPFTSRQSDHAATHLTITAGASDKYLWIFFYNGDTDTETIENILATIQVEVGSSATEYTAYKQPTTYTAELGETVYGGSVELVSGEVVSCFGSVDMGSLTWIYDSANTRFYTASLSSVIEKGSSGWKTELVTDIYTTRDSVNPQTPDKSISEYASTGYVYVRDLDYTDVEFFKAHVTGHDLTYPLATPTESSIDPQEIYPNEGVNNIWNDANGITEVGYFGE